MATLKISDLSVGDWVKVILSKCDYDESDAVDAKVLSIEGNSVGVGYDNRGILMSALVEDLQPIPITAEILEANGFTRRSSELPIYEYITLLGKMLRTTVVSLNHPYSYIVCRIEDTSKELHEPGRITVSSSVDRNPIHIHDLQHALRLAGVDKEINL